MMGNDRVNGVRAGGNDGSGLPSIVARTAPIYDVGRGEVDKMRFGGGKVVIGRDRASCAMLLHTILARMALLEVVKVRSRTFSSLVAEYLVGGFMIQ
jgi:hypothetical protein